MDTKKQPPSVVHMGKLLPRTTRTAAKPPVSGEFCFPQYLRSLGFAELPLCPGPCPPASTPRPCLDTQSSHKPPLTSKSELLLLPGSPRCPYPAPSKLGWSSMLGVSSQKGVLGRGRTMATSPMGTHSPTHELALSKFSTVERME